jgi:hypothetical protein
MQGELRPHRVRYYVERRDPEFESKMAAVLHVYKEVEILNEGLLRGAIHEPGMVTLSSDEKPGIQALAQKAPDRPPIPGQHASPIRDYEYQRLGTVSLLAGPDLHRGTVTEIVSETHKSKDFIELLKKLDAAYLAATTSAQVHVRTSIRIQVLCHKDFIVVAAVLLQGVFFESIFHEARLYSRCACSSWLRVLF